MSKREIPFNKEVIKIAGEQLSKKLNEDLNKKLKQSFLKYASGKNILPLNNFTSSLHLAMCAIDLKRGDKVLCSVNSSPEIPEVVRHFDAEPVFIDIEPNSFQEQSDESAEKQLSFKLDINNLNKVLSELTSKKLKGIILSHIDGELLDIPKIAEIVKKRNLYIIEDGTNSLGLDRQELDKVSDIRLFSFDNDISNLSLFVTDDDSLFQRAKLLSNHGMEIYQDTQLNYIYDILDIGCQYQASKIDLLFTIEIIENISNRLNRRQEIAKKYFSSLKNTPHIEISHFKHNHSYIHFIIKIDKNRDNFAKKLQEHGIETKLHYIPLHLLTYYKSKYQLSINSFPNALRNYQQILSIPIHPFLTDDEVEFIIEIIKTVVDNKII